MRLIPLLCLLAAAALAGCNHGDDGGGDDAGGDGSPYATGEDGAFRAPGSWGAAGSAVDRPSSDAQWESPGDRPDT